MSKVEDRVAQYRLQRPLLDARNRVSGLANNEEVYRFTHMVKVVTEDANVGVVLHVPKEYGVRI